MFDSSDEECSLHGLVGALEKISSSDSLSENDKWLN